MIEILLIEDDEDKRDQIITFINEKVVSNLNEVRSFQSGLKAIKSKNYDLILMDMSIPTFDINSSENGGRAQPFGGELLLFEMIRRNITSKVVLITQFDLFGDGEQEISLTDLDARLLKQFPDIYIGAVHYSISYTSWKEVLFNKINNTK